MTLQASPVHNNISNSDVTQIWERPWSTEEMRQHASDWSLAGDAGLLQYLQRFSQNMITQTHEMEKMMNMLSHETKITCSKVSNVINDFHMLSNIQFVESRVYDEEVQDSPTQAKPQEETKTKEQREAEVVIKISEALNFGLTVINQAFDHITQDQDSDDESPPQIFLKPKDPYAHRKLPYLIGSQEFLSDEFVGVADPIQQQQQQQHEEKTQINFESEDSEDEIPDEIITTINPIRKLITDSDEDLFPKGKISDDENEEEGDGSFNSFGSRDEIDQQTVPNRGPIPPPLLSEPNRGPLPPPLLSEIISSKAKVKRKQILSDDDDLFGGHDVPDDELFGQNSKGIFSSSRGAFKDNKEEDFDEKPKNDLHKADSFSDDGLFGDVKDSPISVPEKFNPSSRPSLSSVASFAPSITSKKTTGGLFDSEDDDDEMFAAPSRKPTATSVKQNDHDGMFAEPPRKPATSVKPPPKITAKPIPKKVENPKPVTSGLFESDDEDGLFDIPAAPAPTKPQKPKLPTGAVSLLGSLAGEIGAAIKSKRAKESDSEDEALLRPDSQISDKSSSSLAKNKKESPSNSSNSLFNDEPDELFTKKPESLKPVVKSLTKDSLFSDDDNDDLFGTTKPVTEAKNLFVTDISEKKSPPEQTIKVEIPPSPPKIEEKKAVPKKVSLFDEDHDDDDDLFSFSSKLSQSPGSLVSKNSEIATLSNTNLIPEPPASPSKVRSASLFDEDKLFAGVAEESPEVDLFSEKKPTVVPDEPDGPTHEPVQKKVSSAPKPIGGVALFGGVDLFGDHLRKTRASSSKHDLFGNEETPKEDEALRPSLKDSKEISVSFEQPVDTTNTLTSAAKDRAKIPTKRRPPSRKGRQSTKPVAIEVEKQTASPSVTNHSVAISEEKKESLLKVVTEMRSPSTEEEDLFPVNEHLTNQLYVESSKLPEKRQPREESADDGSVFDEDELFKKCAKPKTEDKSIFGDDDDDIFSSDLPKIASVQKVDHNNVQKKQNSFVAQEDDDIFSDDIFHSPTVSSATADSVKSLKNQAKSIFDDDDDDNSDIFASSGK